MKKLLLITFLVIGTSSFAGTVKNDKKSKTKAKTAVSCCTVGEFTNCGPDGPANCHASRVQYCNAHQCSKATLASL